jgi:hypothetical protein
MGTPPWMETESTEHTQLQKIRALLSSDLMHVDPGKKITKNAFTWTAGGNIETLKAYDGADLLYTLTFTWNGDGTLQKVERT